MDALDQVVAARLTAQRLVGGSFDDPATTVQHLLAVQSQDFGPSGWSIAQRCPSLDEAGFLQAFNGGELVRTHVLRPTWHLVHPDDLRWLLTLTAPRVHQINGSLYRRLELEPATLGRAAEIIVGALDGATMTRQQLAGVLADVGIEAQGPRLAYVMMFAELEQIICSGPLDGKQHTYMRFDDRVSPARRPFDRDRALRDLAIRYVTGHGPSTARDLAAWASLTQTDARAALESAGDVLAGIDVDGRLFWTDGIDEPRVLDTSVVLLLQAYDELLGSPSANGNLHDRAGKVSDDRWPRFSALALIGGQVAGSWKRTVRSGRLTVEVALLGDASVAIVGGLEAEVERLGTYHGVSQVELALVPAS